MIEVRQTPEYEKWFASLKDRTARVRVDIRIRRLSLGNLGTVEPVGEGVSELKIDHGPGYRVYFIHHGSHCLGRIARCIELAEFLTRAGFGSGRASFKHFLRERAHEDRFGHDA